MDSASLISSVVGVRESAAANQRMVSVAANAARTEQATVATLIEAIQTSAAAYNSSGTATNSSAPGANFQGVA